MATSEKALPAKFTNVLSERDLRLEEKKGLLNMYVKNQNNKALSWVEQKQLMFTGNSYIKFLKGNEDEEAP